MIHCAFENGGKADLRHVTAVAIVLNKDKQILLVRRAAHLNRGGKWTIPGGFLDHGERIYEAVIREIHEETGLDAKNPMLFRINDNPRRPKEDRQNVDFIFVVKDAQGELQINDEVTQFQWVGMDQIPEEDAFAFDHRESIMKYIDYQKHPYDLPIIG